MTETSAPKKLVVVDLDTGVDDALALLFLASRPDVELVALHSTHGNTRADQAANNTRYVMELIGREDVDIRMGLLEPLEQDLHVSAEVHGDDGLGNTGFRPSRPVTGPPDAVENLLRLSHEHAGELHLLALGPTTNIGAALRQDRTLFERLKSVTIVGGIGPALFNDPEPWRNRRTTGSRDPNVFHDVASTLEIAATEGPVTWCGPNITRQIVLPEERFIRAATESGTSHSQFIAKISEYYSDFYTSVYGLTEGAEPPITAAKNTSVDVTGRTRIMGINDSLAAAVLVQPDVVLGSVQRPMRIFHDDHGQACLAGVQTDPPANGPKHRVIFDVDFVRITEMLFQMLRRPLPW
ncbi:MAG: nucleoside hydrolase [Terrimesophilobacter sp.]